MNKLWYPVGIIVIVIAAALLVNFGGYMGPVSGTTTMQNHTTTISSANSSLIYQQQVPILMTDPPQAPNGTSAIVMAYSNLMVHTTGGAGSGWVAANGSGTINLLSSINSTTVIGNANLSANSTVNLVRFNVSSATITVNGTIRNLTLQNRNITVALTSGSRIRTNSSLLVDFFPTIIIDSTANSTRYSMAPSARAILVTNASVRASAAIGAKVSLNAKMRAQLESSAPNVSIAAAQISSSNNTTYISVDVQNDQNSSVVISGVAIYGATSSSVNLRAAPGISIGGSGIRNNLTAVAAAANVKSLGLLSLSATSSGALLAAQSRADWQNAGFTIPSFSGANLTYSGTIIYQNGTVETNLVSGNRYRLVVFGSGGASASTTLSAT